MQTRNETSHLFTRLLKLSDRCVIIEEPELVKNKEEQLGRSDDVNIFKWIFYRLLLFEVFFPSFIPSSSGEKRLKETKKDQAIARRGQIRASVTAAAAGCPVCL